MKGHTKIILTNVETGEQEVHEDENLITNALDKIINIEMAMNHAPNDRILPIATNLLGGIMLFDGELTEDPDNIHFPAEAHLVGYAGQSVNTDDKYRGSYNSVESGKTQTGFVSVWDFGTSQANGTIRAVARTHNHGGTAPLYQFNGPSAVITKAGCPTTDTYWHPIRYDGEYVYMLKIDSTTHVARLARTRIPSLRMGAADYSDVARTYEIVAAWSTEVTDYTYYDSQRYKDEDYNPHTVYVYADDPLMYEDGQDGYLYCVFYGVNWNYHTYGYDLTYFTINYGDGSWEKSDPIRLNVGTGYYSSHQSQSMWCAYREQGHVHRGILYRIRSGRKILDIIPLDNVASRRAVRILQDAESDYIEHLHWICGHEGVIYFEVYHYTASSYNRRHGCLYPDGVFILPERSYNHYARGDSSTPITNGRTCDDDLTVWGYYTDVNIVRNWASNYLGTINNLASEVVKTAAQTMKIIYTLTDVDENEEEAGG